jgi:hypothetical protein
VGRARPRAQRRVQLADRQGREAPRRRAVHQRRAYGALFDARTSPGDSRCARSRTT